MEGKFELEVIPVNNTLTKNMVSFSQYSMFRKCPLQWKLQYVDKIKEKSVSAAMTFGTAMHETIQQYLRLLYNESVHASEEFEINAYLVTRMKECYKKDLAKVNGKHFSNTKEIAEFIDDGKAILHELKRRRRELFPTKNVSLVGIELPLQQPMHNETSLISYVDIILYEHDTSKFRVIDLKTSRMGWRKVHKADPLKTNQVLFYKTYFAKQYNVHPNDVEVEFLILKRQLYEGLDFQRRITRFKPTAGSVTLKKAIKDLNDFVSEVYNPDGTPIKKHYPAISGKNNSHCTYCPFKTNDTLCPKKKRLKNA